jgi:glycerol-3-phosphate cytidylyltransferase-like family protein
MHEKERKEILESIAGVDRVVLTSHPKNPNYMDVSRELLKIKPDIFANGGDRKSEKDIPEVVVCQKIGTKMVFNIGHGGKIQSSSWLLRQYIDKLKPTRKLNVDKILYELNKIS